MVDEAHSSGLFGTDGNRLVHALGLQDRVEIQMGTFSKAYGIYGAYVAAKEQWVDFFINRSRSLIFTTGLHPAVLRLHSKWLLNRESYEKNSLKTVDF
nr:aminotransferase class I/II-fold pyridoxal phosphate-dependent enzyme [Heliobacterium chlorum]